MKCPKCDNEMNIKKQDISHNPENNQRYSRNVHWCEQDDIWISLEIPKKV